MYSLQSSNIAIGGEMPAATPALFGLGTAIAALVIALGGLAMMLGQRSLARTFIGFGIVICVVSAIITEISPLTWLWILVVIGTALFALFTGVRLLQWIIRMIFGAHVSDRVTADIITRVIWPFRRR